MATLSCPGSVPCKVKAPRNAPIRIGGRTYWATVFAPATISASGSATVRARLAAAVLAALGEGRATLRVHLQVRSEEGLAKLLARVPVRRRRGSVGPMPLFAVTTRIPDSVLELLRAEGELRAADRLEALPGEELLALVAGADVVLTQLGDRVDEVLLDAAGPGLRAVCNVAVGYDNVDLGALARRGVALTNTPGVLDDATADVALGLILMATRRLGEGERLIRAGTPWRWSMEFLLGRGLRDKLLGVVGLGAIGGRVAERARAFGMRVAYFNRGEAPAELVARLEAERLEFDELLARADVLTLHTPLTDQTRHLVGARELGLMKPTATLVNTARGPVVDEAALATALRDGEIAAAGLDVFEQEPEVYPGLMELENVVLVPHLGSATVETRTAMAELAARNALAAARGEPLPTPVSLPAR